MTSPTTSVVPDNSPVSVRELAITEARGSLRRVSIWMGFVLTIGILASPTTADWPGGSYTEKLPQSFMPIVLGTFIAAFRTGRRDGRHDVSESAPLDANDRARARLASIALPAFLTLLMAAGLAIASRIEGGFWLGDHPRRTDTALHSLGELIQLPLVVAVVGAAGIAVGRARRAIPVAIIIGAVLFTTFPGYWLWNIPPVHTITPVQTQPLRVELDAGTDVDQLPAEWFVEHSNDNPDRESDAPARQIVHQPTILGHNIYLIGLFGLAVGAAIRGSRGRRLALAAATIATGGVVMQLVVSPL